jgi:hypothetical protein
MDGGCPAGKIGAILTRTSMKIRESFSAGESPKCRTFSRYDNFAKKYRLKTLSPFVQSFQSGENFAEIVAKFSA